MFNQPEAAHCGDATAIAFHQGVKPASWDALSYRVLSWTGYCRHCGWTGPQRDVRSDAAADVQVRRVESADQYAADLQNGVYDAR